MDFFTDHKQSLGQLATFSFPKVITVLTQCRIGTPVPLWRRLRRLSPDGELKTGGVDHLRGPKTKNIGDWFVKNSKKVWENEGN